LSHERRREQTRRRRATEQRQANHARASDQGGLQGHRRAARHRLHHPHLRPDTDAETSEIEPPPAVQGTEEDQRRGCLLTPEYRLAGCGGLFECDGTLTPLVPPDACRQSAKFRIGIAPDGPHTAQHRSHETVRPPLARPDALRRHALAHRKKCLSQNSKIS